MPRSAPNPLPKRASVQVPMEWAQVAIFEACKTEVRTDRKTPTYPTAMRVCTLARIETRNLAPKVNLTRKTTASASPTSSCDSLVPTAAVGIGVTIVAHLAQPGSGIGPGARMASGCIRAARLCGSTARGDRNEPSARNDNSSRYRSCNPCSETGGRGGGRVAYWASEHDHHPHLSVHKSKRASP